MRCPDCRSGLTWNGNEWFCVNCKRLFKKEVLENKSLNQWK